MIPNLQKILKEWSYRVGVIKPTNIEHLEELKSILIEEDWSYDATNEFIQNLTEDEDDVSSSNFKTSKRKKAKKRTNL